MVNERNRFYFLLAGLLIVLLVTPIATESYPGLTSVMMTVTLVVAVFSMATSRRFYSVAWFLVVVKILLAIALFIEPTLGLHLAETGTVLAFFLLATVFSLRRVLEGDEVDMNRIAGAIGVYMLIGLIWTALYHFVYLMNPAAFEGVVAGDISQVTHMNAVFMDLLYYSYVTLSTLGYGDVTPLSRAAQSLAYLEAICGVMYVAVLVAALVGSYGRRRPATA